MPDLFPLDMTSPGRAGCGFRGVHREYPLCSEEELPPNAELRKNKKLQPNLGRELNPGQMIRQDVSFASL